MKENGNRKKKRESEDQVRTAPPSRTQVQGCRVQEEKFKIQLPRDFVRNRARCPPLGAGAIFLWPAAQARGGRTPFKYVTIALRPSVGQWLGGNPWGSCFATIRRVVALRQSAVQCLCDNPCVFALRQPAGYLLCDHPMNSCFATIRRVVALRLPVGVIALRQPVG